MVTKEQIEAAGLDDLRVFGRQFWDHLKLPPPTPMQNDMLKWLQRALTNPEHDRHILSAFRGIGKTQCLAVAALWYLFYINPNAKIVIVSASAEYAKQISTFMKLLLESHPLLEHMKPRKGQRDSVEAFDVGTADIDRQPSVVCLGITSQLPGNRADLIIADDVETPSTSMTPAAREDLRKRVADFEFILKPGGVICYLGTPQVEQSLYPRLLANGYRMTVYPAELPERVETYKGNLAPYIHRLIEKGGKPGDPADTRFGPDELEKRRLAAGKAAYMLQYMLDTNPSSVDRHPLKLHNLLVTDVDDKMGHVSLVWSRDREHILKDLHIGGFDGDFYVGPAFKSPEMQGWYGTVGAIDVSSRGKDETSLAIVRYLAGTLYLVHLHGWKDGHSENTLREIAAKCLRYGVTDIVIERNGGGHMFAQLLKPHLARVGLEKDAEGERLDGRDDGDRPKHAGMINEEWKGQWAQGQKEVRILQTLAPVTESHRLVVDRRVIEADIEQMHSDPKYSFVVQYTRMQDLRGALAHDDRVDSLALAVQYWCDKMDVTGVQALERKRQKDADEAKRAFARGALGGRRHSVRPRWQNTFPLGEN